MKPQFKTIENTLRFEKKDIYQIDLLDGNGKQQSFECTANHPFYVINKGFVRTDHLTLTDQCLDCYGNKLMIKAIQKTVKIDTVYDLTVANTHTFFVGNSGAWVHNSATIADRFELKLKPDHELNQLGIYNIHLRRLIRIAHEILEESDLVKAADKANLAGVEFGAKYMENYIPGAGTADDIANFGDSFFIPNGRKTGQELATSFNDHMAGKNLKPSEEGPIFTRLMPFSILKSTRK